MKIRRNAPWLGAVFVCIALPGCADPHDEHTHDEGLLARLVVSDGVEGHLTVIDLDEGAFVGTHEIAGPARLHRSAGGRFAFAHQSALGIVNIIDSGIHIESHGDHAHTDLYAPELLDFALEGTAPIHFTRHDGQSVVFFDGKLATDQAAGVTARAVIVPEISLLTGAPEAITVALPAAQHGVAVPVGNGLLVTSDVPAPQGASAPLPNGVSATDWEGNVLQAFDASCPSLHGEASLDADRFAFACAAHVLVVERESEDADFTTRTIGYPDTRRAGALVASNDGAYVFADYEDDDDFEVLRIDVLTGAIVALRFEAAISEFVALPALDEELVVLTVDGRLHVVDIASFAVVHTWEAVAAFVASHTNPHADVTTASDVAYVSAPATGRVLEFRVGEREPGRTFDVGGMPVSIVVLGPATAVEDAHEH